MSDTVNKLHRRNTAEQNKKMIEKAVWGSPEMRELRESTKAQFKVDMKDEKNFPVGSPDFSWKSFKEKAFREGISASTFPQLLRAGVQTVVNNLYSTVDSTYEEWAHVVPSQKDTELYAPLHGLTFLSEVGPGQKFIESNVQGLDIKLKNRKFGELFPVERELIEDDQTGQMIQMASLMAEYAKLAIEVYCYGKLASVSGMAYSNLTIPTSETKPADESSYPWSTSLQGGGATRPNAYGALSQANIQSGIIALMNQKNLLGLKMLVKPDTIIISPAKRFDLSVLLNSAYYPSGAAAAGNVGGAFAINPIYNVLAKPVVSRFVFKNDGTVNGDSTAWYLCDGSKPAFVAQIREAASVSQENPQSGESFDRDVLRWKLRLRFNADFIDPRFFWQGSDGTA